MVIVITLRDAFAIQGGTNHRDAQRIAKHHTVGVMTTGCVHRLYCVQSILQQIGAANTTASVSFIVR